MTPLYFTAKYYLTYDDPVLLLTDSGFMAP